MAVTARPSWPGSTPIWLPSSAPSDKCPPATSFRPKRGGGIEQIRDYCTEEAGAQVARHVLGQITKALRFLAETPGAGHRRDDLMDEEVRFWSVLSYLIAYDPAMRPIGIARVLHAGRDLQALFQRTPPRM